MKPWTILRTALFVSLIAAIAAGADEVYQKGTITKGSGIHPYYELKGPSVHIQISNCGDFQTGQTVDYRVEGNKVYIHRENGKEYKCSIEATVGISALPPYLHGTILGWGTQRYANNWSFGGAPPVTREHKFYDLKGAGTLYQINDCGDFQTGQVVDYRVDESDKHDKKIYIRRDRGGAYECKLEGARAVEGNEPDAPSAAPAAPPAAAAPPAKP